MYYAKIKPMDVANGPGLRTCLFVSGCTHRCKGCFNQETWDFKYGEPFTSETIELIIKYMERKEIKGITILGGEPMEPANQKGILPLLKRVKEVYPGKSIWCYTGYDFERDILGKMMYENEETKELLACLDVLVDGKFMEDKKDMTLRFKGSSNQRIIMVQRSLEEGEIILWDEA